MEPGGGFWRTVEDVKQHADRGELEAEYCAQAERVLARGLVPQHLDVHMGMSDDKVFERIARRYGLKAQPSPCLLKAKRLDLCHPFDTYPGSRQPADEELLSYLPIEGKAARFRRYLEELPEGIHFNLCHPAVDSDELTSLCSPSCHLGDWARDRRVSDTEVILDPGLRSLCEKLGIRRAAIRDLMREVVV
jgi:hypothetical protein